ncbi:MAG TPA: aliphatic sulfonate ABC transporter substrate-binding protein [Gallionella sp.]|nr:aliphatic sulfonate ABC transporter substrate-binding protein [Gallionella sp.]
MKGIKKVVASIVATMVLSGAAWAENVKEVRLDYATYSPTSLAVKKMGWMEDEFKKDGISVKWVFSQGSANALDFLKKGSIDFGSTAGLAAVLARANGNPVKGVYVFSKPEWAALVVGKDSSITSVKALKGKKIAATPGTDPYLFVLRTLALNGMSKADVEIVSMPHVLGRKALENKEVDAWGALDPHKSASVLEAGSKVLYRNPDFCTYGFLNTTDTFAKEHPDVIKRVLSVYEKGRAWVKSHPDDAAQLMSEEAKISLTVAKAQLKLNDFSNSVPGAEHIKALKAAAPILADEKLVASEAAAIDAVDKVVDGSFAKGLK